MYIITISISMKPINKFDNYMPQQVIPHIWTICRETEVQLEVTCR